MIHCLMFVRYVINEHSHFHAGHVLIITTSVVVVYSIYYEHYINYPNHQPLLIIKTYHLD